MILYDPTRIVQNSYEDMAAFSTMHYFIRESLKGVLWKPSVQNYYLNLGLNAAELSTQLIEKTYRSRGFYHFVVSERGKIRDIHSVHISERAVQKALCNVILKPAIVPRLYEYNCASLEGKGTSYALGALKRDLVRAYSKYGKNAYILITDYHAYYDSIRHDILLNMFRNWIEDDDGYGLFEYFVHMFDYIKIPNNEMNKEIKTQYSIPSKPDDISNPHSPLGKGVLDHRNLILADDQDIIDADEHVMNDIDFGLGLGLGSEISQIAAVAYTNHIDHGIKEIYRADAYTKYMDDSYIIDHDYGKLQAILDYITYESANIGLTFNPKHTHIYKITDHYRFLKKRIHVVPETGKVLMQLDGPAITKHRNTIVAQYNLLIQGNIRFDTIFYSFYGWRQSVLGMDSYNNIKELSHVFYRLYKDFMTPEQKQKLFTISKGER